MTRKFKVGDRVRVIKVYREPKYLGLELTILRGPKSFRDDELGIWEGWETDGGWFAPEQLTLVYDGDEPGSWESLADIYVPNRIAEWQP